MRQRPERADDVLEFFNRPLVPIYLEVHLAGKVAPRIWTAFVFSVHNRWMLMTAGHCITEVERERLGGAKVLNCKLLVGPDSQAAHMPTLYPSSMTPSDRGCLACMRI